MLFGKNYMIAFFASLYKKPQDTIFSPVKKIRYRHFIVI